MINIDPNSNLILSYDLTHFIWDLKNDKINIRVKYQTTLRKEYIKDFEFEASDHIDVNELIEKVISLHDGKNI